MRPSRIRILSVLLVLWITARGQDTTSAVVATGHPPIPVDSLRSFAQPAFAIGEHLIFDVGFSFITAGEGSFQILGADSIHGRECYRVVFTVNSVPSFSWIYKVQDRYETFLDAKGIFPWRFEQHVREGGYHLDYAADFDQIDGIAYADKKTFPIPPYVHDVVSAFYYVRTMDFSQSRPGQKYMLHNFFKDSTYQLAVKFLGRQQISVDAGKFNTVVIEPLIKEGGLFKSKGRVLIWLTDDERKMPVKVSTEIVVGSIEAELREYSGVILPINAKIK